MSEDTLIWVCDCPEYGGDCGAWLELTNDGILAIEDKDGLRVSIMLPGWLDEAMRIGLLAHSHPAAANEESLPSQSIRWPEPTVAAPELVTLEEWMSEDGGCEATDGCWCEPDGVCRHGYPSWLLYMGLI